MMSIFKFVSYDALEHFWKRITQRYDKKLDSVTNKDETIEVSSGCEIAVRVSSAENNNLENKDGLYVPKNHTLTVGDKVYDGTQDVEVPIYDGSYEIR